MPVNQQERAEEIIARRTQKGIDALATIEIQSDAQINTLDIGRNPEIGERCLEALGKTFAWPNPYKNGTPEFEAYEKIVAPKRVII